jgi:hypothetical protein
MPNSAKAAIVGDEKEPLNREITEPRTFLRSIATSDTDGSSSDDIFEYSLRINSRATKNGRSASLQLLDLQRVFDD